MSYLIEFWNPGGWKPYCIFHGNIDEVLAWMPTHFRAKDESHLTRLKPCDLISEALEAIDKAWDIPMSKTEFSTTDPRHDDA